jgi:hypothetical protein
MAGPNSIRSAYKGTTRGGPVFSPDTVQILFSRPLARSTMTDALGESPGSEPVPDCWHTRRPRDQSIQKGAVCHV